MEQSVLLRTIQIIAFAMIMGVFMFGIITYTVLTSDHFFSLDINSDSLLLIIGFMSVISLVMSRIMFKMQLKGVEKLSFKQKKAKYQTAIIISMAILEGVALFGIAQFMISNNLTYIFSSVLLFVVMILSFPTKFKFISSCQLTREEINQLQNLK